MSFIVLVSFVTIPVLVIAEEDIRAAYFVSCALVFVICMSILGFIFGPKVWAGANQQVSKKSIATTVKNHKTNTTFSADDVSYASTVQSSHEGALILEHPKKNEDMKAELKELKKLKREWEKEQRKAKEPAQVNVVDTDDYGEPVSTLSLGFGSSARMSIESEAEHAPER